MKTAIDARSLLQALEHQHPNADTELDYSNPFELLVATILSAQTTDVGVNSVTPALFARYPDADALSAAAQPELEGLIKKTGFFRQKARALIGMAQALVSDHGGQVAAAIDALVKLPGVGRKTANVVLGHALGVPGLPVDRHVLRVANRLGLVHSEDPEVVEQQLGAVLPRQQWTLAADTMTLHGRRICKPKPMCDRCEVRDDCAYFRSGAAFPAGRPARAKTPVRRAGARSRASKK
jgi:endonuclease III